MLKSILLSVVRFAKSFIKTSLKNLRQALLDRPDEWNSELALRLGNSLSMTLGYERPASSDWDAEKLIQMSESLAHIHPGL